MKAHVQTKVALTIGSLFLAFPVQGDTQRDGGDYPIPTILITPEWYPHDQQILPSASHQLSGQQLDKAGVRNTQDLQYSLPGLVFKSSAGVGDPYLRGVGGTVSASGESGVATFVDSVYLTRTVQALQELYDVDRIEVVKGPEGVYLGRNMLGGAISLHTRDPVPYHEAYGDVLVGSHNQRQLRGALNLPLSDTGLAVRLAGTMKQRDGYSRNVFRHEDLDDQDYQALRGKLRYRPSEALDLVFSAERSRQDDTRDLAAYPNPEFGVNGGILLGGIVPDDPRQVTANVGQYQKIDSTLYSTRVNWRGEGLHVQSVTAYQKTVQHNALDLDNTNIDFSANFPASSSSAISQELRIGSRTVQGIDWIIGLFFQQEDAWQNQDVHLPLADVRNLSVSDATNRVHAAFGELSYAFTPKWQGRIGLRYSHDEGELDLAQTITDPYGMLGPPGTYSLVSRQRDHWTALTPALGVRYTLDANTRLHANVTRGYKPGGFNAYAAQSAYDAERLWSWEAGIKRYFPLRRLHLDATLFHYDYRDIQLLTLPPGSPAGTLPIIDNAARASVDGLEFQVRYQPTWHLALSVGATLLDARYRDFVSVDPNNPATDPDRAGDSLQQAPDISLLLGAEHKRDVAGGTLRMAVDYRYQSAVYFNPYQDRAVRQGGYSLLNAQLGFHSRKDSWYAELYANNLADKLYSQNIIRIDPVVGTVRYWGKPRTFGLRIGYTL
jgi:iron complex outermembrane receptor protein